MATSSSNCLAQLPTIHRPKAVRPKILKSSSLSFSFSNLSQRAALPTQSSPWENRALQSLQTPLGARSKFAESEAALNPSLPGLSLETLAGVKESETEFKSLQEMAQAEREVSSNHTGRFPNLGRELIRANSQDLFYERCSASNRVCGVTLQEVKDIPARPGNPMVRDTCFCRRSKELYDAETEESASGDSEGLSLGAGED